MFSIIDNWAKNKSVFMLTNIYAVLFVFCSAGLVVPMLQLFLMPSMNPLWFIPGVFVFVITMNIIHRILNLIAKKNSPKKLV